MAFWSRFFGSAGSTAAGVAIGATAVPALTPAAQFLINEAWGTYPDKPPEALVLAEAVAQGKVDPDSAKLWARHQGFGDDQWAALLAAARVGPGIARAFELWWRNVIDEAGFRRAVERSGFEPEWIDDLVKIKRVLLSPAELAVMVQRGIVANDNLLPVGPPTTAGKVPPMPMVNIDPITEAAGSGYTEEELAALARIVGLPASPDLAARMVFRGIIDPVDFDRAISEGNTRNEWAPFLFEGFRQIPTAEQFVEAHLRGWITLAEMYAGTARHGMSKADTDLEFEIHRRPLTVRAITTALARGGKFLPQAGEITDPYEASVHQANLGPEWYDLAIANKHSYSVPFWWRALVTAGVLSQAEGEQILLDIGNPPDLAAKVAAHFATAGGTTTAAAKLNPWVARADTHLWTAVQKGYIGGKVDVPNATISLDLIGVSATAQAEVFARWDETKRIEAL